MKSDDILGDIGEAQQLQLILLERFRKGRFFPYTIIELGDFVKCDIFPRGLERVPIEAYRLVVDTFSGGSTLTRVWAIEFCCKPYGDFGVSFIRRVELQVHGELRVLKASAGLWWMTLEHSLITGIIGLTDNHPFRERVPQNHMLELSISV